VKYDDADSGLRYFERLLGLSQGLRGLGVAIYRHDWHCLVMGSWSIIAGVRHRSFLFSWDGREGFISVQGPFHADLGTPASSPTVAHERLGIDPALEPLDYVKSFFQSSHHA
jgi:hypothetical protein